MQTTRRSFFIKTGAVSIAYKLAGAAPQLPSAGPNGQIGMGFIGVGIRGSYHLDNFKKAPGVHAVMAADCYDGHLAWAKETTDGKIETTRDYHELLNRKDIDAVVISTPDHWHARMILDSLAAGKHVFVEKPMAMTSAEAADLVQAAESAKRVLMVGHLLEYHGAVRRLKELVDSNAHGKQE